MKIYIKMLFLVAVVGSLGVLANPQSTMLANINAMRASGQYCPGGGGGRAVPALKYSGTLTQVAQTHATRMGTQGFLSHYYGGASARTRVARAGYSFSRMSEIIHKGSNSNPSAAMRWWKNSPVHCRAIMNPNYTHIGVGYHSRGNAWAVEMAN